ncbi:hypothetical protein Ancab_002313, partial [Ancistrocladus abbreviatus]
FNFPCPFPTSNNEVCGFGGESLVRVERRRKEGICVDRGNRDGSLQDDHQSFNLELAPTTRSQGNHWDHPLSDCSKLVQRARVCRT